MPLRKRVFTNKCHFWKYSLLGATWDPIERDHRNRSLGKAGEAFVVDLERRHLSEADRPDLARKVRWIATEDGDGAGYDVLSFNREGREQLIEVKTTNGSARTPFFFDSQRVRPSSRTPRRLADLSSSFVRQGPSHFYCRAAFRRASGLVLVGNSATISGLNHVDFFSSERSIALKRFLTFEYRAHNINPMSGCSKNEKATRGKHSDGVMVQKGPSKP